VYKELVSIGEVAAETGLSPEVLRVWERRYGFPVPVRLPSGHRRFREEDLRRLRLIAVALAQGRRPAQVVRLSLDALLALAGPADSELTAPLRDILAALETLDSAEVRRRLHAAHETLGLLPFLCEVVSPLLDEVGARWADGRLAVQYEHLLTEILEDLLRALRQGFQPTADAPRVVVGSLPGERHRLGLLMAALVYAARGARVEVLGADLPIVALASAVQTLGADTLGISISLGSGGELARQLVRDVRERLPSSVKIIVGGQGAMRLGSVEGVNRVRGLEVGR
jgi:DNA-binding transcriptional MerR regulator